jgi:RsiW-degrading membrane proteinase PrsW (M82 family)
MSAKELLEKPEKVVSAVKLLYLMIAIGVVRTGMTVLRHADVRSPYSLIFTKILVYSVSLFLIYQISQGKNWARWLFLVIFAIAFPLSVLPTFDAISHNPVHALLGFLQLGLYIIAMVYLFHRSSTEWLGSGKSPG